MEVTSFFKANGTLGSNSFNQSSFAYKITNAKNLIRVEPEMDLRLAGPLSCDLLLGFGTVVNGLKPKTSSSIAVFGKGGVGLAALIAV